MTTETSEPYLILNVNDGVDTLHDPNHLQEACNTDDIKDRRRVDEMTAEALVLRGDAVTCRHCNPSL